MTRISIEAYEAAERELLLTRACRTWRRHAVTFALALGVTVLAGVLWGGPP